MAYYLIKYEKGVYASSELFCDAVAGGERTFIRLLAERAASGTRVLDQMWYPVDREQRERCAAYQPNEQDFDEAFNRIKPAGAARSGRVITVPRTLAPDLLEYGGYRFMRLREFNRLDKYRLLPQLASVRVGSKTYVALDAVTSAAANPIVVTVA